MLKTIVFYASHYGSTQRYAQWIAQALGCEAKAVGDCKSLQLSDYGTVIFGGGLYAGGINGAKFLAERLTELEGAHIILFTVGLSPVEDAEQFRPSLEKAFPTELLSKSRNFHLRGGMDKTSLSLSHKAMIGMLCAMLRSKPEHQRTEADAGMLACCSTSQDYTDQATIRPLVEYAAGL